MNTSSNNTLSIPEEMYDECIRVRTRKYLTKRGFQSLLGKLLYVQKCVHSARIFINRILMLFRENTHKNSIYLHQEFYSDIDWLITFLPMFSGVTFLRKPPVDEKHSHSPRS